MRRHTIQLLQRIFTAISIAALLGIFLIVARVFGLSLPWTTDAPQGLVVSAFNKTIAIVSGHAGYDSGAVCTDDSGAITLTEADVTAAIATLVEGRLRRAGADVILLEEYDPRLEGLEADVLLSLHADSCIDTTGYKAAYYTNSRQPFTEDRLLSCLNTHYAAATNLPYHPNTVTHDMTEYHAFRRVAPTTPAAILEMGFLGGDRVLLTENQGQVAAGIVESIVCFLESDLPPE